MNIQNKEFLVIIKDILSTKEVNNLRLYKHHYSTNRYEHCLAVSYYSYKLCRFLGLDHVSSARGGFLHDLFLYDCETSKSKPKDHIKAHPKVALTNAKKLFILNDIEEDIIVNHMWPITFSKPEYLETFVVSFIDKYCSIKEFYNYCKYSIWSLYLFWIYT